MATLFTLFWLTWIMLTTVVNGYDALNLKLFTEMTPPPGEAGGLLNAFYGSAVMVFIAVVVGTPIGILAGVFLAEFHRRTRTGESIRFVNDILLGAPSSWSACSFMNWWFDRLDISQDGREDWPWRLSCCR